MVKVVIIVMNLMSRHIAGCTTTTTRQEEVEQVEEVEVEEVEEAEVEVEENHDSYEGSLRECCCCY